MNPDVLEKVLECRRLPSLPAVAVKVIELTKDDDVAMSELASTIQNDQALAAKVLRTVNSSFYGLRQRVSSIQQAIVILGLSAVKTLALGFSLVSAIEDSDTGEFDHAGYWRRALLTGVSARSIATSTRGESPEECFLGGLLQDVGMIALQQAMPKRYAQVLAQAGPDHRALAKTELAELEVQHPDIGAMLAERWKLPTTLMLPIKYHERPTAAPSEHLDIVRAVGLGNLAADVMTSEEPAPALRKYYQRAEQWFGLKEGAADEILTKAGEDTKQVASLLQLDAGESPKSTAILAEAKEQMAAIPIPPTRTASSSGIVNMDESQEGVDDLTGLPDRHAFDQMLVAAFEQAIVGANELALALFEIDGLDELVAQYGPDIGDNIVVSVAGRLADTTVPWEQVMVCRYVDARFAMMMTKTDRTEAVRMAEEVRKALDAAPIEIIAGKSAPPTLPITLSAGVACVGEAGGSRFRDPCDLTGVVEKAVAAAKRAGTNTLRVYAPSRSKAA